MFIHRRMVRYSDVNIVDNFDTRRSIRESPSLIGSIAFGGKNYPS
jgi:hypothetical protein